MERLQDRDERYSRDQTADILDLAAAIEDVTRDGGLDLSRQDLYRIAGELDISHEAVDEAIRAMARDQTRSAKDLRKSVRRRMRFVRHAMAYVITVTVLAVVDALGGGGWWFFYVAGGWGILLALHALRFVTRRNGPLEQRMLTR